MTKCRYAFGDQSGVSSIEAELVQRSQPQQHYPSGPEMLLGPVGKPGA